MASEAGPPSVLAKKTLDYIEDLRKKYHVKGIAASIVQRVGPEDGEATWKTETPCFGVYDTEDTPMAPDNVYLIASASKLFTVLGIGLLIHRGAKLPNGEEVKWTTKIRSVLPDWGIQDETINTQADIEDLLSMRWGLPGHQSLGGKKGDTIETLLPALRHLKTNAELRKNFQYTNQGYSIVGHIISLLSGKSYATFINDEVLQPLGMTFSTYDQAAALQAGKRVQGWTRFNKDPLKLKEAIESDQWDDSVLGESIAVPFWNEGYGEWFMACGGLWTSANDLVKWQKELLQPKLFSKELLDEVIKPRIPTFMGTEHPEFAPQLYGMAQFLEHYRGHAFAQHGGGVPGYYTCQIRLPKEGIAIFLTVNDEGYGPLLNYVLGLRIVDDLLGLPPIDWEKRILHKWLTDIPDYGSIPASPRAPASIVGSYSHPAYGKIRVVRLEDHPEKDLLTLLIRQNPINTLPGLSSQLFIGDVDQEVEVVGRLLFVPFDGPIFTRAFIKSDPILPSKGSNVSEKQSHIGGMWLVGKAVITDKGLGMFENYWWKGPSAPSSTLSETDPQSAAEVWYSRI